VIGWRHGTGFPTDLPGKRRHRRHARRRLTVESLRQEILNAQQTRSDLLKWKLGLVGALGATGLGLAGADTPGHADLVLCAVPLVSVYVDLLCRHLSLRILVVGRYLHQSGAGQRSEREDLKLYETFVEEKARQLVPQPTERREEEQRMNAFDLEDWAVSWSSVTLSLGVALYGIFVISSAVAPAVALIASGTLGLVVTMLARESYHRRQWALRAIS
jgi:hypothetical protein